MEAAPRLPMISFDLLTTTENVQFGKKLKPYIATFYNEDPDSYTTEFSKLDALRAAAVRPSLDLAGLQTLKKYYCQLHFLKSRFPMQPDQACFIAFEWNDPQNCSSSGSIDLELMAILYNIGVLHTILGAQDSRSNPEGMKMACSHFQCAVWAFQTVKEKHSEAVVYFSTLEIPHFYKQVCLAQAQECILEKSMLDNRKSTIISKVAIQVWEYYRQAFASLKSLSGRSKYKEWSNYLQFKLAYHRSISLLFQGQQAEELQKMGERVAFYQSASDHLQEAQKYLTSKQQKELEDALAFTTDVVEGKRKAAKNENEYIYHEEVPDISTLQEAKGASLVKGIEFNINDPEVSGPDIFARLVPMAVHEAASVYSEKKAEVLRNIGQKVDEKDQELVEFMSSMQLDMLTKMQHATGIPQELIDRAASVSAKPTAVKDIIDIMANLSNIYHDVEANLNEIDALLVLEEEREKSYQEEMGTRPPSIITTDLAREAVKYKEAHSKAKESNHALGKAMMANMENLKLLQTPIRELEQKLPSVDRPNPNIDEAALKELEMLNAKVDEMKAQRAMLWAQLRDAFHNDDVTQSLVTRQENKSLEDIFRSQLEKHSQLIEVLEQNLAAQDNIKKAFVDCYAKSVNTRRYIQDIIQKRSSTIQALSAAHDSYDSLMLKALKGVEFYTKLETNVSKLLQRIKSACEVQQEEREQMLAKSVSKKQTNHSSNLPVTTSTPKLKDYLEARKKAAEQASNASPVNYGGVAPNLSDKQNWPPSIRPAPVGSEFTTDPTTMLINETPAVSPYYPQYQYGAVPKPAATGKSYYIPSQAPDLPDEFLQNDAQINDVTNRMASLSGKDISVSHYDHAYNPQENIYSSYTPQNYVPASLPPSSYYSEVQSDVPLGTQDVNKATTDTTNSYHQTITSYSQNAQHSGYMQQYPYPYANPNQTNYHYVQTETGIGQYEGVQPQSPQLQLQPQFQQQQPVLPQQQQQLQQQQQQSQLQQEQPQPQLQQQQHSMQEQGHSQLQQQHQQLQQYLQQGYYYQQPPYGSISYPTASTPAAITPLHVNTSQSYFPEGYVPGYVNPVDVPSKHTDSFASYNSHYYMQEHMTSVASGIPNVSMNGGVYTAPVEDLYKVLPGSLDYPHMSTGVSESPGIFSVGAAVTTPTGGHYNYNDAYGVPQPYYDATNTTNSYKYPTSSSQAVMPPETPISTVVKESNVDLLTGLDFSATSNIPTLIPQTHKTVDPPKQSAVTETKPVVIEKKQPTAKPVEFPVKEEIKVFPSKPLNNSEVKTLFGQELEKYEKYVESLTHKTLSGPTMLDIKWKEIQENQELDNQKRIISVARCYPAKNRYADILPYDYTRVELKSTADDYINASFVKQISPCGPQFIVTQAPMASTVTDFWSMVYEQQVELLVCLLNDNELGGDIYWPVDKQHPLILTNNSNGMFRINLQNITVKNHWTERLLTIDLPEKRQSWNVLLLQYTSWPGSLFPVTPESFVSLVLEIISLFQQQKMLYHPILVHCSSGIGRSGLICLLTNAILEVTNRATTVPDLASLTINLSNFRKNILRDREHLKFAYEAMLCYMKQLVSQDNLKKKLSEIDSSKSEEPPTETAAKVQEKLVDPLSTIDPFWASKK